MQLKLNSPAQMTNTINRRTQCRKRKGVKLPKLVTSVDTTTSRYIRKKEHLHKCFSVSQVP